MTRDPEDRILDACLEELLGGAEAPDLTDQILAQLREASGAADEQATGPEPEERILDTCLEEVVGGAQPPELAPQILARLNDPSPVAGEASEPVPPPLPEPEAPPVASRPSPTSATQATTPVPAPSRNGQSAVRSRRRRSSSSRVAIVGWLTAAAAALLAGAIIWKQLGVDGNSTVKAPDQPSPAPDRPDQDPGGNSAVPPDNAIVDKPAPEPKPEIGLDPFDEPLFPTDKEDLFTTNSPPPKQQPRRIPSAHDQLPDEQVVQLANQMLGESWREAGVTAAPATDEQWCRRLFLRMLGRIPTVDELQTLAADSAPDRRQRLIRELTEGEEYAEEFSAHWASFWATVLIGRRGGMDDDSPASREHLEQYLRRVIHDEVPYDDMVRELVAADGAGRPGGDDFNPAANFLLASMDENGLLATARTFQVFHGQQLRCIQCHSHPANDAWTQRQFWSLNAFFRQMRVERGSEGARLVDRDFRGEGPGGIDEAEVFFEQLNGETVAALPAYPGSNVAVPASGRVSKVRRRQVLSKLIAEDDRLARAAVNRLWSHFHGYGFTRPIDDMGPHRPVSHPELLSHLADQFANGGYKLNRLVGWIAAADSFSRTSQVTLTAAADSPEAGGRPLFSRYYTRQLQPEAVYDSLVMVAEASPRETGIDGRARWLGQFYRPMGTDEGEEQSSFNGDMRQSLIIMNGPLMRRATNSGNKDGTLHRVINSRMPLDQKVEHLFMASVARKPTRRELSAIKNLLQKQPNEASALESVWWALLNSNEFILDH